ncbi:MULTISPECIES: chitin disaccharide deacetylase [Serratia]|uniref:chitin disaccharide deacetylase n=1 Tax=Serratia TaxID=613 RepID=UPI001AEA8956|nr:MULTISPECIES: chitin disaccharide deacetylase [Serratia]MBP1038637.1 chitin disaccharide deacetylase [Serratia fonticola]UAN60412.1 chitin disaccharide deacetylase [Serratia sp. JSRIV004]
MRKILIVNADDFGMSKGQNYGIIESYNNGIVTSTTAMVTSPYVTHAAKLSQKHPGLGVGLHFTLTYGRPLTAMKKLVNEKGELGKWLWEYAQKGMVEPAEITAELNAQFERFIDIFGRTPTHLDSHHFVHMLPQIYPLVEHFANKKSLPLRIDRREIKKHDIQFNNFRSTDYFDSSFYGDTISETLILQLLDDADKRGDKSLEIMCHPAFLDDTILKSSYSYPRVKEIEILTSQNLKREIIYRGYILGNYSSI